MPATARRFGVTDSFDARQNIFAGTRYLRILLDTFGEDISLGRGLQRRRRRSGPLRRDPALPGDPGLRSQGERPPGSVVDAVHAVAVAAPLFIVPGETPRKAPVSQPASPVVKRPRVYYQWRDANGIVHLEQAPPATGEFKTIRSTD